MTEISKLEDMDSDFLSSNCQAGENGSRKFSISDHVNCLQHSMTKSDSFVVDMERFSHLLEKDINANSRNITLQRNLSRKGSGRERKIISNERDSSMAVTSPRATFHGSSTPEKPVVVAMGSQDHSTTPQLHHHHQITITNGGVSSSTAPAECKSLGRRFSFRRMIDPRRILFFFATLSCIGTILLIYFTLSMGNLKGDENDLN